MSERAAMDNSPQKQIKPANLIYGKDDSVPAASMAPLAVQQVVLVASDAVYPLLLVLSIGGSLDMAQNMISLMMIALGIGTVLQAMRGRIVGSGFLCGQETGFIAPSFMAMQAGGLPLLCGMTMAAGVFQMFFSRIIERLRILFPVEIVGSIMLFALPVYLTAAIPAFFGLENGSLPDRRVVQLSLVTVGTIVGLHIWGNRRCQEYALFAGIVVGYLGAHLFGLISAEQYEKLQAAKWLALPSLDHGGFRFDPLLLPAFLITSLANSVDTVGNLTLCQKLNDEQWKRLDFASIRGGLLAEGMGNICSGLLGTLGQGTNGASVGMAAATGATSRQIGFVTGALLIGLGFVPKLSVFFAIMPKSVIGALLIVSVAFFLPPAMQLCTSRMLDARRILVVGISTAFAYGVALTPELGKSLPETMQYVIAEPFSFGALIAIGLHLLFRIGIASHQKAAIKPDLAAVDTVDAFFKRCGGIWGARPEVVAKASTTVSQFFESAHELNLVRGDIMIDASFEEFNLDVELRYQGELLEFPDCRPSEQELMADDAAFIRLAGFLLTRFADKITSEKKGDCCMIRFNFEH